MDPQPVRPTRLAYAIPVLILIAGMTGFAQLLLTKIGGLSQSLTQVLVPGRKILSLEEPGTYTIFHEYESEMGGRVISSRGVALNVECTVLAQTNGEKILLSRPSTSSTYTLGGREGTSVLEFTITTPGLYDFSCANADSKTEPIAVFAIGHGFMGMLFGLIGTALLILFGSLAAALGLTLWIHAGRKSSRAAMQTSQGNPQIRNVPLG